MTTFTASLPGGEPPLFEGKDVEVTSPARELVMLHWPAGRAAAAYRALGAQIAARGGRVTAICGVQRGAGTSVTAANLALALAEGGARRVCLVDLDLYRPAQARLFGIQPRAGVLELAEGEQRPELARVTPGLWLLAAGREQAGTAERKTAPAQAVAAPAVAAAIDYARGAYDFVILDAPALLDASDLLVISEVIDLVSLVTRAEQTRRDAFAEAVSRVPREKLLGVILNDAPSFAVPR